MSTIQFIKSFLIRLQSPKIRQSFRNIIETNMDSGKTVEWDAPLQYLLMKTALDMYDGTPFANDEQLERVAMEVYDRSFQTMSALSQELPEQANKNPR